jgi:hypothetical protein
MQLYRLMTNVRAGAGHPQCAEGQAGIVTIWVRATSAEDATQRADEILRSHPYSSREELSVYLEEASEPPPGAEAVGLAEELRSSSSAPAGYQAIKDTALKQADGLFETWFPPEV